jgi:amino acid adenylation domain-containing protein
MVNSLSSGRASILAVLKHWKDRDPNRVLYEFLANGDSSESTLTFGELDLRVRAIGAVLRDLGLAGQRALLLFHPGLDFVTAFLGAMAGGMIPVPSPLPRRDQAGDLLTPLVQDAAPSVVLTSHYLSSRIKRLAAEVPALAAMRCVAVDEIPAAAAADWTDPGLRPESLAFLQYTSGSTSTPKGVCVTHANLLHNEASLQRVFGHDQESVIVGWLPLFHDMGLIGNLLQPLYAGARCILMSPLAFLQQPVRWLRAISDHGATTSGGPNFAYDLCSRRVREEQLQDLDLSSWRVAFNGAEPVRAETLQRFAARFGPWGFQRSAFLPCYGLAEATLFVSGCRDEAGFHVTDRAAACGRVACGRPLDDQRVVIVDAASRRPLGAGEVGEIWIAGPSVTQGYWGRAAESAACFAATLAGSAGGGRFLRTGDLGMLDGGELFVTGRLKDLVILRGRNLYPHDLERVAEQSHPLLRPGGAAAFAVEVEGDERLAIVLEWGGQTAASAGEAIAAIRDVLGSRYEVQVYDVCLIAPGALPRTTSGKVRRHACRAALEAGRLEVLARSVLAAASDRDDVGDGVRVARPACEEDPEEDPTSLPAELRALVCRVLQVEPAALGERSLVSLGLDSLTAIELRGAVEERFGVAVDLPTLFSGAGFPQLLDAVAGTRPAPPTVPAPWARAGAAAAPETAAQPLSAGQKGLWFLCQMSPQSPAYNLLGCGRVRGLAPALLRRAVARLVERHELLRSTFESVAGEPRRRVHPDLAIPIVEVDATRWGRAEVDAWLAEEERRLFDLVHGPLLRVSVVAIAADEHLLVLVLHHLIADFQSLAVLVRELGIFYSAPAGGADLPALAGTYADFAHWQERDLAGAHGERLWAYWRDRLAGDIPPLELGRDRARPSLPSGRGGSVASRLPRHLAAGLQSLAAGTGGSLFATVLAALQVLLLRHTGKTDFSIGAPAAARSRPWMAGVVGYCVAPVVLRANLDPSVPFRELLGQVRGTLARDLEHQGYPLPVLAERLQPQRDPRREAFFEVMLLVPGRGGKATEDLTAFALRDDGGTVDLGGLQLESLRFAHGTSFVDLNVLVGLVGGELCMRLQYSSDLFDRTTCERLLARFAALLADVVRAPDTRLEALACLPPAESSQLLFEWGPGAADSRSDDCLHQLFARQAVRRPEAVALVAGTERLTYGQLAARSRRLARSLRALGVGPEVRVGVCLDRSAELVVALLAILEAGGAYVPVDPAYPPARIAVILADARVKVLVLQDSHRSLVEAVEADRLAAATLWIDSRAGLAETAGTALAVAAPAAGRSTAGEEEPYTNSAGPENLAYVIFTSGSTGRPKGVAVEHRSAVARVLWAGREFGADLLAGVLFSTSVCFDLSVFELFVPLCNGGCVILAENALGLRGLPARAEVRLLNTVPSAFAELLHLDALPPSLTAINLGGEAMSAGLAARLAAHGRWQVRNLYGPTEDTVYSTSARLDAERSAATVIGRSLPGSRAYVLDRGLRPVPTAEAGELFLGGIGLARGYLDRPAETAARFVPDPFSDEPGGRLYRTGDLARWLPRGELLFEGRADHQVKLRGFRIELGEVEAALLAGGAVREAVAVLRDLAGGPGIVAYVVPAPGAVPSTESLLAGLVGCLPGYMLPSLVEQLPALPLTPNGKIDRRALPPPRQGAQDDGGEEGAGSGAGTGGAGSRGARKEPQDPVEGLLCGVWREVLGVERVGVGDDFFQLGGHSLLVARAVARVREVLGVELQMTEVFEAPTPRGLAARIAADRRASGAPPLVRRPRQPRQEEAPLSFAQQRLWFLAQLQPAATAYNVPAVVSLAGRLGVAELAAAWGALEKRHESLRTTFRHRRSEGEEKGGEPYQHIAAAREGRWWLPLVDLRGLAAARRLAEAGRLASEEARRRFDLAAGPLARLTLLRLAAEEHWALLTLHHVVADGWSMGNLVRELGVLYGAALSGEPSSLAAPAVQYADYAVWQRGWLQGEVLSSLVAYWRERLAGAPKLLELPLDHVRPAVQEGRAGRLMVDLPAELLRAAAAVSLGRGVTLFMTLLGSFAVWLARLTGQGDLPIGTPVANRGQLAAEDLIGYIANTLVLRCAVGMSASFAAVLGAVRSTALAAYDHQELPFEKLVEELRIGRALSHSPLVQVVFALQSAPLEVRLPGLVLRRLPAESGGAKFDLSLSLTESAGGLRGEVEYDAALFEETTVRRWLGQWERLLAHAVGEPDTRVEDLRLLSAGERQQLVREWALGAVGAGAGLSVVQRIARVAVRHPESLAVAEGEQRLTYGELARRVRRWSSRLRALGVGPEVRVGICLPRGMEHVVAALAVLAAGGAYLPLDPDLPASRLRFMVEDAGAPVVLSRGERAPGLREVAARIVGLAELEREGANGGEASAGAVGRTSGPSDLSDPSGPLDLSNLSGPSERSGPSDPSEPGPAGLAYVIYTSGSSGRPKGVAVSHEGLGNLVDWHVSSYQVMAEDRGSLVAAPGFDASVWEIWPYLCAGASLHVVSEECRLDPERLVEWLSREGITCCFLPTPLAEAVLRIPMERHRGLERLRWLLTGGDRLQALPAGALPCRVVNHYGPTEATVVTLSCEVAGGSLLPAAAALAPGRHESAAAPAIGRPIAGARVYLLGADQAPAPLGARGEIAIGGRGLARGYLGRPELTAESFVPDPWSGEAGARLYRSGDLGRYLAAGAVDFLGRLDQQVKIRGRRIEIGEVEAALGRHKEVLEAAVVAVPTAAGARLVACVAASRPLGLEELLAELRRELPDYMLPSRAITLASLPVTPHGKVDRQALSALAAQEPAAAEALYQAPRSGLEELLCGVWREVLGVERVGVHDDFFQLGGHSLLVAHLRMKLVELLEIEVPVRRFFEAPTVAELAVAVAEQMIEEADSEESILVAAARGAA